MVTLVGQDSSPVGDYFYGTKLLGRSIGPVHGLVHRDDSWMRGISRCPFGSGYPQNDSQWLMDERRIEFKKRQESARKDIERTFVTLKDKWYVVKRPMRVWSQRKLQEIMYTCIILHNMIREDESFSHYPFDPMEVLTEDIETNISKEDRAINVNLVKNREKHVNLRADLSQHVWDSMYLKNKKDGKGGTSKDEMFIPIPSKKTVVCTKWVFSTILSYATHKDIKVYEMDMRVPFLNRKYQEEVYVEQPSAFLDSKYLSYLYKLDKALYGLK
ncbi:hypothetical protein OSB04_003016 [Centaurea solstitialis]|uniref:Reverse transcriptase Ty1/copia-type domain-containing protein n=1 Tax=Centaurea solstitialis TaxID=347529 RepID=A0AA38WTI8_9ASTR|nr:hypothetical protein OSB04_003016 [Centaurea solstitialis]